MQVKPFKAFRFDSSDVGGCIAPPYDVIGEPRQQQLYEKNPYNIVRITKGKTKPSDSDTDNQYTRAADYLNTWIEKGILKQDLAEAIYAYIQDFELAGTWFQRSSFIALAKLEEFGETVRPHEQTLSAPKIDRLNLQRATAAQFGLVFMLYKDEKKIAEKICEATSDKKPLVDFVDEENIRHRLFAITAEDDINAITEMMLDKSCIIADGHHRYETALNYSKETANPAAKYQMAAFSNICQNGLVVLATHRLVGSLENFDSKKFIAVLRKDFEVTEYLFPSPAAKPDARKKMLSQMKAEHTHDKNAFGIYTGNGAFYTAVLKDKHTMDSAAPDKSSAFRALDVSVLHKMVLEKLLGIDEEKLAAGGNLEYVKDTEYAIDESIVAVDAGQKQIAFFMNPPTTSQIKTITEAGERMPQKSTFFYPKVYTGLTINKL